MTSHNTFRPVYSHPFTLEEAMLLEINILVAGTFSRSRMISTFPILPEIKQYGIIADGKEVARLQNSILHLQETQVELRSYLEEEPEDEDGEIGLAISENETTMYVTPYLIS